MHQLMYSQVSLDYFDTEKKKFLRQDLHLKVSKWIHAQGRVSFSEKCKSH